MNKQDVFNNVDNLKDVCVNTCRTIWNHPEVSGEEKDSANYYRNVLKENGFKIINSKKLEHAFYAEYGQGKPVVALLGEYDALPGLSQKAWTVKSPIVPGGAGHGCGHNMLGSAQLTGALAIKKYLEENKISGTVRFYGCPQEELLDGKVRMIEEGLFRGCDLAISWHPNDATYVHDRAYLANTSMKFFFHGKSSHAAFAPDRGRSALDAVELMNVGCNYLREHVVDHSRIHYMSSCTGFAPNIVPAEASVWYYVRAPKISDVKDIARRVELVAQGAAIMTETTVDVEHGYGCCEFKENNAMGDLTYQNLVEVGLPSYTDEELNFAKELQESVDKTIVDKGKIAYHSDSIMHSVVGDRDLWVNNVMTASSDTGDVSYLIPTALFTISTWPIGVSPHTWQASACAGTTIGEKGAFTAAKVIAGLAYDFYNKPEEVEKIKAEFEARVESEYVPMIGDK